MAGLEPDSAVRSEAQSEPDGGTGAAPAATTPWSARFSRRTVLRVTGVTALAAAAGSLIGARGGVASPPRRRHASTPAGARAGAEPAGSAGPSVISSGDTITIGFVTPLTGPLAGFA